MQITAALRHRQIPAFAGMECTFFRSFCENLPEFAQISDFFAFFRHFGYLPNDSVYLQNAPKGTFNGIIAGRGKGIFAAIIGNEKAAVFFCKQTADIRAKIITHIKTNVNKTTIRKLAA